MSCLWYQSWIHVSCFEKSLYFILWEKNKGKFDISWIFRGAELWLCEMSADKRLFRCSALHLTQLRPEMELQQSVKSKRQVTGRSAHSAETHQHHREELFTDSEAMSIPPACDPEPDWTGEWVQTWGESPPTFWRRSISCCFALRTAKACSCSSSSCCLRSAASRICCPQGESAGLESHREGRQTAPPATQPQFKQRDQIPIAGATVNLYVSQVLQVHTSHKQRLDSNFNLHLSPLSCSSASAGENTTGNRTKMSSHFLAFLTEGAHGCGLAVLGWRYTSAQPGLLALQVTQKPLKELSHTVFTWSMKRLHERLSKVCSMLTHLWPFITPNEARQNKNPGSKSACEVQSWRWLELGVWTVMDWPDPSGLEMNQSSSPSGGPDGFQTGNRKTAGRTFLKGTSREGRLHFQNSVSIWQHFKSIHMILHNKTLSIT